MHWVVGANPTWVIFNLMNYINSSLNFCSFSNSVFSPQDKDFKSQNMFHAHLNPKAIVKSTFETYMKYSPTEAYLGRTFFWGLTPHAGEVIRFCFVHPVIIERLVIHFFFIWALVFFGYDVSVFSNRRCVENNFLV